MAAVGAGAGKVFFYLNHIDIPMVDLDKKLHGALQPHIEAANTRRLYNGAIVQIPQLHVVLPAHQKSSAEGIRV